MPSESRFAPVPIVGFGLKPPTHARSLGPTVHDCWPSDSILFVLCEPLSVTSNDMLRRSSSVALICASRPLFRTEPRFSNTERSGEPDDAAIGLLISASFVTLL